MSEDYQSLPNKIVVNIPDTDLNNQGAQSAPADKYAHLRITAEKIIERSAPILTFAGQPYAAKKNVSVVSAGSKEWKTGLMNAYQSCILSSNGTIPEYPSLSAEPNIQRLPILSFDCEQSEDNQQENLNTNLADAELEYTPEYYCCYNVRSIPVGERLSAISEIIEYYYNKFGSICAVFIDPSTDLLHSVNDEAESKTVVTSLLDLADKYDTAIIVSIHVNPGFEKKERGHFGSELQRKCFGMIFISKEKEVFKVVPKLLRKGSTNIPPVTLIYSPELGRVIETTIETKPDTENKQGKYLKLVGEMFSQQSVLSPKDAQEKVINFCRVKERGAYGIIKKLIDQNLITKTVAGYEKVI